MNENSHYLQAIQDAGVHITTDEDDVVVADWSGFPNVDLPPAEPLSTKLKRTKFNTQEVKELMEWRSAADKECISPERAMEHFAALNPQHSLGAWKSKWSNETKKRKERADFEASIDSYFSSKAPKTTDANDASDHNDQQFLGPPSADQQELSSPLQNGMSSIHGSTDQAEQEPLFSHVNPFPTDPLGDTSYEFAKVENMKTILGWLNLAHEAELEAWVVQPWVLGAYTEMAEATLDQELLDQERHDRRSKLTQNATYNTVAARAMEAIREQIPRYIESGVAKDHWTVDDHNIRFVVSLIRGGREQLWAEYQSEEHLPTLCNKATFFLMWLRWLHRPLQGQGSTQRHLRKRQDRYLELLRHGRGVSGVAIIPETSHSDQVTIPREPEATLSEDERSTDQDLDLHSAIYADNGAIGSSLSFDRADTGSGSLEINPASVSTDLATTNIRCKDSTSNASSAADRVEARSSFHGDASVSLTRITRPPGQQAPGAGWLQFEAASTWLNHCSQRMQSWGVKIDHAGTCIIQPHEWRYQEPRKLMNTFEWNILLNGGDDFHCLTFTYQSETLPWARAATWFLPWSRHGKPPKGADLDNFFAHADAKDMTRSEASHLCHQALCINPNHLVLESRKINMSRNSCRAFAPRLRRYGFQIPAYCQEDTHNPPCLLQHSALGFEETVAIQFFVLRQACGQSTDPPLQPPPDFKHKFCTFENRLPLSIPVGGPAAVSVRAHHLQMPQERPPIYAHKDPFRCTFCHDALREWKKVDSYYSHVRACHPEVCEADKLKEICRLTARYLKSHERWEGDTTKGRTLNYMLQTQEPNFNWEDVQSWVLYADSKIAGRNIKEAGLASDLIR